MLDPTLRRTAMALVIGGVLVAGGCGSDDDSSTTAAGEGSAETVRLWVEPDVVECDGGAGPQDCLEVARTEGGDLELFYDTIEGFDFEAGTSYVIDVSVAEVDDPPADGSSLRYTLVDVVESTP